MKRCSSCNNEKDESEFYFDSRKPDGFKSQCKKCHGLGNVRTRDEEKHRKNNAEYMRRNRIENLEKVRQKERARSRLKDEKTRARDLLNSAVKAGRIIKPRHCDRCGSASKITGHHPDYSKPLDVLWLCYSCHGKEHRAISFKRV